MIIDIKSDTCPCCSSKFHRYGEDVAERLDIVLAQFRVLVPRHQVLVSKYADHLPLYCQARINAR